MKTILRSETVIIPEGVTCEVRARIVIVKGPRGTLTKDLKHLPIDLEWTDESHTKLKVGRWFTSGKANSVIRTTCSHIENMIIGVTKGFKYKMRFVYAHFPINVAITNKDKRVEIRNFLGEKVFARRLCAKSRTQRKHFAAHTAPGIKRGSRGKGFLRQRARAALPRVKMGRAQFTARRALVTYLSAHAAAFVLPGRPHCRCPRRRHGVALLRYQGRDCPHWQRHQQRVAHVRAHPADLCRQAEGYP